MRQTGLLSGGCVVGVAALMLWLGAAPALATPTSCRNTGNFSRWLTQFKKEARAKGVTGRTISSAAPYLTFSQRIVNLDRRQSFFALSFLKFSDRLASNHRIRRGPKLIKKHRRTFARVKKDYGVPASVIVAFWALESDFGVNMGKVSSLRSLTTLAYDCRRPELFRPELLAALRIIQRGDLRASDMIGSWAGELGQTQFLPTHYFNHAVDYDGDGRRNLLKSVPDVMASTAAFLRHIGWKPGQPWLREVRVPARMKWSQADLTIRHPRATWVSWGVRAAHGRALPQDKVPASLLLPMGRQGPAFLAYDNFRVYLEWNKSLVYATTAAYLATRMAGAPKMRRGPKGLAHYDYKQALVIQRLLVRRGYDVGGVDGKMGVQTRAALKAAQIKYGLPADSYPSAQLISRLRRRR